MEVPVIKWDRKGRLFCPTCKVIVAAVLPDHRLGRGPGRCRVGHEFKITDHAAFAINEIWDKQLGADKGLGREFFRNIGDESVDELTKP